MAVPYVDGCRHREVRLTVGHQEAVAQLHGTVVQQPSGRLDHSCFDFAQLHAHATNLHLKRTANCVALTTWACFHIGSMFILG